MPHRQMQMLLMVRRRIIRYDVKRTPIRGFEIAQKMGIIVIPYSGLSRKARREAKKVSPDGFYLEPGDGREYIYYDDTSVMAAYRLSMTNPMDFIGGS